MSDTDPRKRLSEFFDTIWGPTSGLAYVPERAQNGEWTQRFYRWPQRKELIVDAVLAGSAIKKDVYFSPVLWKVGSDDISSVSNVLQSRVLWADFDGNGPSDWFDNGIEGLTSGSQRPPGPPSLVIQSSSETHQHAYWILTEPITDMAVLESTNRSLAYGMGADTSGWDASQILRPPFSTNYKRDMPVMWAVDNVETTYQIDQFQHFPSVKVLVSDNIPDEKELPTVVDIVAKYSLATETIDLLQKDIPEGSRSSALMRIGYDGAEKGLTEAEIYSLLLHMDDKLGKFTGRSDRRKRLLDIVNKAKQKYPHATEDPTFAGLDNTQPVAEAELQITYRFNEFITQQFHTNWAVQDVLPERGLGLIVSAPNVGKSQLGLRLLMAQVVGGSCAGYQHHEPGVGMFFSCEMGRAGLQKISRTMSPEGDMSNLIMVALGESMHLDSSPSAKTFFEDLLKTYKPKGIVIDSLQKVISGSINDDDSIREFFSYLQSVCQRFDCYIWVIHHTRKAQGDNKKPKTQADIYGSGFIAASVDVALCLWPLDAQNKQIEVLQLKNRYAEIAMPKTVTRTADLNFEVDGGFNGFNRPDSETDSGESNRQTIDREFF